MKSADEPSMAGWARLIGNADRKLPLSWWVLDGLTALADARLAKLLICSGVDQASMQLCEPSVGPGVACREAAVKPSQHACKLKGVLQSKLCLPDDFAVAYADLHRKQHRRHLHCQGYPPAVAQCAQDHCTYLPH